MAASTVLLHPVPQPPTLVCQEMGLPHSSPQPATILTLSLFDTIMGRFLFFCLCRVVGSPASESKTTVNLTLGFTFADDFTEYLICLAEDFNFLRPDFHSSGIGLLQQKAVELPEVQNQGLELLIEDCKCYLKGKGCKFLTCVWMM